PGRVGPRRPPRDEPAGPARPAQRSHRLRVPGRWRPRVRRNDRVGVPPRAEPRRLTRRALGRRRDLGPGSRLGALLGADRPALLQGHQLRVRPNGPTHHRRGARRSHAGVWRTGLATLIHEERAQGISVVEGGLHYPTSTGPTPVRGLTADLAGPGRPAYRPRRGPARPGSRRGRG